MLKNKLIAATALSFGIAMASSPAFAGTDTQTMNVTVTQNAACEMVIPGDIFSNFDNNTWEKSFPLLMVKCNESLPYSVEISTDDASGNFAMTDEATQKSINGRAQISADPTPENGDIGGLAFQSWGLESNNAALTSVGTGEFQNFSTSFELNTDQKTATVGTYTRDLDITLNY